MNIPMGGYATARALVLDCPMDLSISGSRNHDETVCRGEAQQNYRAVADSSCFRMAYRIVKVFCRVNLCCIILVPTLVFYYSVNQLASPAGNLDHGAIWGSYLGLVLLAAIYVAIGVLLLPLVKPDNSLCAGCGTLLFFYDGFVAGLPAWP